MKEKLRKPVQKHGSIKPRLREPGSSTTGTAAFHPKTDLGRRLWKIRRQIAESGEPLLGWEELEREVAERSGQNQS